MTLIKPFLLALVMNGSMLTQPFSWQLDCSSVVHEHETWLLTLLNSVSELLDIELVVSVV